MSRPFLKIIAVLNLISYLAVVTVNALANALPIAGRNTGEISDSLPNYFVPAGITFSIWGIIYLLLGLWAVWQMISVFKEREPGIGMTSRIRLCFILSSLANIGWILSWHFGLYTLSLLLMLVILGALIRIYLVLGIGRERQSPGAVWAGQIPFSVYFGWITVATVANITALLVHLGWNGFGLSEPVWALLVIIVAAVIALAVVLRHRDIGYGLVILWAYIGIILARTGGANQSVMVAVGTAVCGGLVLLSVLRALVIRNR